MHGAWGASGIGVTMHDTSDMRDKLHLVDAGPPRKPCGGVS